ncbi:MAG: alpha/beta fold hydrolase, partial [Pseudomonadota bacterium]
LAVLLAGYQLEGARTGLTITDMRVGSTPATRYQLPEQRGPLVVVAHGFAGSRQLMHPFSLNLARSGYIVLAFDFEGHGRNPRPMSGDVTQIDGTTALLVAETRRVLEAGRALPQVDGRAALLGHSMATDIIVRAAAQERSEGQPVEAVVAISMFSEAVTGQTPERLLMITGQFESYLRKAALAALHQVDPNAKAGETIRSGSVERRAVVAPRVEHVGVLYSESAGKEARQWLDRSFDRSSTAALIPLGLWILLLLLAVVLFLRPLAHSLAPDPSPMPALPRGRFLLAAWLPAVLVPLAATAVYVQFLPVLVADYLMIHLVLYGLLQWMLLGAPWSSLRKLSLWGTALLVVWGIGAFGFALDRYAASFFPTAERLPLIGVLTLGTVPFMVSDSAITQAGRANIWRRVGARVPFFASLVAAAALDPERLTFVLIVLPVIVLFFVVQGLMGRWVGQRSGAAAAGLGLGLCLAWALGVSFPLFAGS